jgi:2-succinyl-6-hydroxy-2,4-cyclohexadiene-1-carboxylate synthase
MIWALHGMVGEPADWDFLRATVPNLEAPLLWAEVDRYLPWAEQFTNRVRQIDPNPVLMGYSMGGRLALHALLAAPGLFRAAIIISAHPGLADRRLRQIRWRQDDEWAAKIRSVPWQTFLRIWNDQAVFNGSAPPGERLTTFKWRQGIIRSFDCWGLSRQEDLLPRLGSIATPVLWITGENDPRYTSLAASAVEALPQARHEIVPRAGHRVPWEAPDLFLERVSRFISQESLLT